MPYNKLKCVATGEEITDDDKPLLVVIRDNRFYSHPLAAVHPDMLRTAKTIQITLTRKDVNAPFEGASFQCIESFEKSNYDEYH